MRLFKINIHTSVHFNIEVTVYFIVKDDKAH